MLWKCARPTAFALLGCMCHLCCASTAPLQCVDGFIFCALGLSHLRLYRISCHWCPKWSRSVSPRRVMSTQCRLESCNVGCARPSSSAVPRGAEKPSHVCRGYFGHAPPQLDPVSGVITAEELMTATNGALDAAEAGVLIGSDATATLEDLTKLVQRKHHND